MSEKSIFNLWQSTSTNTPTEISTMSLTSSTTSTTAPVAKIEKELNILIKAGEANNNILIETIEKVISNIEILLMIIIILMSVIVLYKITKLCRKGYAQHNEKIIKKHETANTRV